MARLQYIGARYVPVWYHNSVDDTANWEVNVEYEPLTWVTTENNHLYLSKKTVPDNIGTPAQNTEYWLDMGVFNSGSIAELETRVAALEEEYSDIDAALIAMQSVVSGLGDSVAGLSAEVLAINTIKNRKFVFIGDSYAAMTTLFQDVVTSMGIASDHYVIQSANGISFAGSTGHFIDRLAAALNDIEGTSVTDIVVVGGLNDSVNAYTDSGELWAAMSTFNDYAKEYCPNAKVHLGYCGHVDISNVNAAQRTWHKQYITLDRYINYSGSLGWHYMTNIEYTLRGIRSYLSSDGVHPTVDGTRALVQAVVLSLTGTYDCKYVDASLSHNYAASVNNGSINVFSTSLYMKDNGVISFTLNPFELTYSLGSTNFSVLASDITITDYPFYEILTGHEFFFHTPATFAYNDGADKFMEVDTMITFGQGKVTVKPYPFINGANNWITATPKKLITKPVQITLPTMRV